MAEEESEPRGGPKRDYQVSGGMVGCGLGEDLGKEVERGVNPEWGGGGPVVAESIMGRCEINRETSGRGRRKKVEFWCAELESLDG